MKALVTGGAGFIGSNIVRTLVEEGHDVTVLDNLSSGYKHNLDPYPEIQFIQGDIRDEEVVKRAVGRAEVIYHLAASVGNKRAIDFPVVDAEVNVLGTLRILEAARKAGSRKIVVSSSAGIYGELKYLPIKEDHPAEPDTQYGASKLCAEKQCLAYAKLYDIEAVGLRYFNVFGPNQRFDAYGNVIPIFAFRMLRGEPITIFGDGEQTRDFVNVRDVVQANIKAGMSVGVSGAFNIASGTRITINHLVASLRETGVADAIVEYSAPRPGDVRHSIADISAAAAAFGYKPEVDMTSGLNQYMRWAQDEVAKS